MSMPSASDMMGQMQMQMQQQMAQTQMHMAQMHQANMIQMEEVQRSSQIQFQQTETNRWFNKINKIKSKDTKQLSS